VGFIFIEESRSTSCNREAVNMVFLRGGRIASRGAIFLRFLVSGVFGIVDVEIGDIFWSDVTQYSRL